MTENTTTLGIVGQTMKDLLPRVNAGFNWSIIRERYDESPVGTAMSVHLTDESGEESIEQVMLGIVEGPRIVILDELTPEWEYIGAIVTYQDYGLRILDVDDPMTPDKARYQHGGVSIHPADGESRERVWLVTSNVLDIMLETLVWQQQQAADGVEAES
jgi:hypothetical protein